MIQTDLLSDGASDAQGLCSLVTRPLPGFLVWGTSLSLFRGMRLKIVLKFIYVYTDPFLE